MIELKKEQITLTENNDQNFINGSKVLFEVNDNSIVDHFEGFFYVFLFAETFAVKVKEKYGPLQNTWTVVSGYSGNKEEIEALKEGFDFFL